MIEVADEISSASDEVIFGLNNENPPCVDGCNPFLSNIFKTILTRIKVWL